MFIFDDGYKNNIDLVILILERKGIFVIFFVIVIDSFFYFMLWIDYFDLVNLLLCDIVCIDG